MKLTSENQKIIVDWISNKCGNMRCICCGNGKWSILDFSTLQIGFDLNTTRFHFHDGMPLASIACENCGHVVQFNTAVMGIKPTPIPEEKTE